MAGKPNKPLDQYPPVKPGDLPPITALPGAPGATPPEAPQRRPAAKLAFVDPSKLVRSEPLQHPFVWEDRTYTAVEVRCPTVEEVSAIVADQPEELGWWPLYALMTGLPEEVLRGMAEPDGKAVLDRCRGFLPHLFGAATAPSSS